MSFGRKTPSVVISHMPADHILEYENYSGYDKTTQKIKASEVHQPANILSTYSR